MVIFGWWDSKDYGNHINDFDYAKCTHISYSSIHVTSATDPTLIAEPTMTANFSKLSALIAKCHSAGVKCLVNMGDVSGSADLPAVLSNSTLRHTLNTNLVNLVNTYNLDGVDLDWEVYPTNPASLYLTWVQELRAALGTGKLITVDGYPDNGYPNYYITSAMLPYIDYVVTMLYCYSYDDWTYFTYRWSNWCNIPASKIICGIAATGFNYYMGNGGIPWSPYSWVCKQAGWATNVDKIYTTSALSLYYPWSPGYYEEPMFPVGSGTTSKDYLYFDGIDSTKNKALYLKNNAYAGMAIFCINCDVPTSDTKSLLTNIYNTVGGINMATIVFLPGSSHTGTVPLTVIPSGISCAAELFVGPNASTKTATSGPISFTSTGASQNVVCPLTMPTAGGTYGDYLNVTSGGVLIGAFAGGDSIEIVTVTVGTVTWS
jgi:hypothetical protein